MDNYVRKLTFTGNTYYYNSEGYIHRLDGPAVVVGKCGSVEYWIKNKRLSKEQFDSHPDVVKLRIEKHLLGVI
jgi:hypothetical protein